MEKLPDRKELNEVKRFCNDYNDVQIWSCVKKLVLNVNELQKRIEKLERIKQYKQGV